MRKSWADRRFSKKRKELKSEMYAPGEKRVREHIVGCVIRRNGTFYGKGEGHLAHCEVRRKHFPNDETPYKAPPDEDQFFETDRGAILDRKQAAYTAYVAGQLTFNKSQLFSDDIDWKKYAKT
jgi:hypothetical protein